MHAGVFNLGTRVHIFVLGRHLGLGNCGGLGGWKTCRGSIGGPLPVKHLITIQENPGYRAVRSLKMPAMRA